MGRLVCDNWRDWVRSHREPYHIYMGVSTIEVEYSVLACNNSYGPCCLYWFNHLSCIRSCFYHLSIQDIF